MNYNTLVGPKSELGSIRGWVNHELTPSADIVTEAEQFIYSRLRVREMRFLLTGNVGLGVTFFALPDRYLGSLRLRVLHPQAGPMKLEQLPWHDFEDQLPLDLDGNLPSAAPTNFTTDASSIYLNTKTDAAMTYRWWAYARPAPLSAANKSNFLTDRFPHLLGAACRHFAFAYWRKPEADGFLTKAAQYIEDANAQAEAEMSDIYSENKHE